MFVYILHLSRVFDSIGKQKKTPHISEIPGVQENIGSMFYYTKNE